MDFMETIWHWVRVNLGSDLFTIYLSDDEKEIEVQLKALDQDMITQELAEHGKALCLELFTKGHGSWDTSTASTKEFVLTKN